MIYGVDYEKSSIGREFETCGNCQKPSDNLVFLENEWNFNACPECAEWCHAVETAEPCPDLHRAVVTANSVEEARKALRAHLDMECLHCGPTKKAVSADRCVHGTGEARCCRPISKAEVA